MNNGLEIAIIGLAGKFPGAKDAEEYWHNLEQGIESIHFYDESELNPETTRQGLQKKSNFVNAGGKLANIDLFDAEFFNFSPKEAEILDPQHRLFLETAWTALENAGYDSEQYQGSIGVFGGAGMNGYQFNLFRNPDVTQTTSNYELFLGSEKDFLTTRVSYKLNLEGPSVNLQTACSTSLVAVHVAAQSLLSGECDMALAGGVAISLSTGYLAQEGSIYSPDGHCRAFAENAQGTVGGSGVGIVVLKRLEDAIAEQDHVLAIVKGSAIDNDGALKVSYTAPRIDTQARVIQTAQLVGEVEPETISYIEAHGTGTSLGDPIEIAALTQAFRTSTDKKQFCAISSVKTNIGHLDAAAGVASLIKAVLALQNKSIPPSLNCDRPNSKIDWENSPFFVNRELKTWESNGLVRRAGVSSFGIGGTNAHVVLEEAPRLGAEGHEEHGGAAVEARVGERRKGMSTKREGQDPSTLLVISAKTETALETATVNLSEHLSHNPDLDLKDVAYTLQVGRRAFDYRLTLVCKSVTDAINQLENRQEVFSNKIEAGSKPVVFMFSGQGSQYLGMAQELYQNEPIFKESCDRCFQLLQPYLDLDLNEIIFPFTPHLPISPAPSPLINQTQYAQPAIFAIEYALAQLLSHWGIKPEATIGHSIGEYVAATLAEVFSLEDALKLVADRARLMQQQPTGVMLSVALAASDVTAVIEKSSSPAELSLAVVNTPELCVISGTEKAIAELENTFMDQGVACRRLKTSHGFHSYLMDGAVSPFVEIVKQVKLHPPRIPFISNITGTWITDAQATDPEYWGQQIRPTVQFAKGVETITSESERILLEVGAGRALTTLAKQIHPQSTILQSLPHIKQKQNQSDRAFLLRTCSQLWLAGVDFNWSNFYPQKPSRIPLPTYPFERKRYWVEATTELTSNAVIATTENRDISEWFYLPSWSRDLPSPSHFASE
ncbi:MAG: type I polyketide synthase [Cyanobacteria bacterium J06642_3]